MKKLFTLLIFVSLFSCRQPTVEEVKNDGRIKTVLNDGTLRIVNVDGHEYLIKDQGGIFHLESCPCKKPR